MYHPPVRDLRPDTPDVEIQRYSLRLRWMRWMKDEGRISDYLSVSPDVWTDEAIFRLIGEIKPEEPAKPDGSVSFNPLDYND